MKALSLMRLAKAVLAFLTLPALGQTTPSAGTSLGPLPMGQPVRLTEIIGSPVKNLRDEKIGIIKDLALNLQNGRIEEIVVARGGVFGMDQKLVGVPPQNFSAEAGGKNLRLTVETDKLDGAPSIDLSQWNEVTAPSRLKEVYQYFGARPYFLDPEFAGQSGNNSAAEASGALIRAIQLVHASTVNHFDQDLGRVEDLIVDVPSGRVVEIIIASGRMLGIKDELSEVPPQAVHFNADRAVLMLNTTAKALAIAPHFSNRAWPRIDRKHVGQVYRAYFVVPYFVPTDMDDTVQIVGAPINHFEAFLN